MRSTPEPAVSTCHRRRGRRLIRIAMMRRDPADLALAVSAMPPRSSHTFTDLHGFGLTAATVPPSMGRWRRTASDAATPPEVGLPTSVLKKDQSATADSIAQPHLDDCGRRRGHPHQPVRWAALRYEGSDAFTRLTAAASILKTDRTEAKLFVMCASASP